jgi:hypothetical protein
MTDKQNALNQIKEIMDTHNISAHDLKALNIGKEAKSKQNQDVFKTIFAYLGGLFIFSGLGTLVGLLWDDLNSPLRVLITLGPGIIGWLSAFPAFMTSVTAK